jgi:uncharacterized protein YlxW (UPF0749 family)
MAEKAKVTPEQKITKLEEDIKNIQEKEERLSEQRILLEQKLFRLKLQKEREQ